MSQYEFYEYRERERKGEVSQIEVACQNQRGQFLDTHRVITTWRVDDGEVSIQSLGFRDTNGDSRDTSGDSFGVITRVVAIAVTKIEERGYEVDSPFERESLETTLDEGE